MLASGAIDLERLPDGTYRASSAMFPDCQATAATAEAARAAVMQAIDELLRARAEAERDEEVAD